MHPEWWDYIINKLDYNGTELNVVWLKGRRRSRGISSRAPLCEGGISSRTALCEGGISSRAPLCEGGISSRAPLCEGSFRPRAPLCEGSIRFRAPLCEGGINSRAPLYEGGISSRAPLCLTKFDKGSPQKQTGRPVSSLDKARQYLGPRCVGRRRQATLPLPR